MARHAHDRSGGTAGPTGPTSERPKKRPRSGGARAVRCPVTPAREMPDNRGLCGRRSSEVSTGARVDESSSGPLSPTIARGVCLLPRALAVATELAYRAITAGWLGQIVLFWNAPASFPGRRRARSVMRSGTPSKPTGSRAGSCQLNGKVFTARFATGPGPEFVNRLWPHRDNRFWPHLAVRPSASERGWSSAGRSQSPSR